MDLTRSNTKGEIGRGLQLFLFWVIVQTVIIVFLDSFRILPSTIGIALGWKGAYLDAGHWPFALDYHSCFCGVLGCIYTAIGCALIAKNGLNSVEWWRKFLLWYMAYIAMTWLLVWGIGSYVLDIWFAPLLWLAELEAFNVLQRKHNERKVREVEMTIY